MVKHIVFWRLADKAEGNKKEANAAIIKERLEALNGVIPQIRALQVGINKNDGEYDLALDSVFDSMEDLKAYDQDPRHGLVREFVHKVTEARAAVDFEF